MSKTQNRNDEYMSVKKTAALLDTSIKFIYFHFGRGDIPGRRIGRKIFISKEALTKLMDIQPTNEEKNADDK
jgi:hypothetical protein